MVDETVYPAICLLSADKTVSWGYVAITNIKPSGQFFALADIFDDAVNSDRVHPRPLIFGRDSEFAERPSTVLIYRNASRVSISGLRCRRLDRSVGIALRGN